MLLDAQNAIGDLAVQSLENPSTTLNVKVAAGVYADQSGTVTTYAGTSSFALTASNTNYLYLDLTSSGALTKSTSAFPATAHVRIATVLALTSTVSTITDARVAFSAIGPWADGVNLSFSVSTGTKIGTATSQKIGFWNATPIIQPSGATQAAPASYTTGAFGLDSDVNMHALYDLVVAMRTALVNAGLMKGSA